MIYLMTHSVYQIIALVVRMEFETMYRACFVFGQNNICYLMKLKLAANTCMWSVIDEGMGAEQW
jgi:hypothetical protein